jgi:hypothetical protein
MYSAALQRYYNEHEHLPYTFYAQPKRSHRPYKPYLAAYLTQRLLQISLEEIPMRDIRSYDSYTLAL